MEAGSFTPREAGFLSLLFLFPFVVLWGLVPIKGYFLCYMNKFSVESISILASGAIVALYGIIRFVVIFASDVNLAGITFFASVAACCYIIVFALKNRDLNLLFATCALYFLYPMFILFRSAQDADTGYLFYAFGGLLAQMALTLFISVFKKSSGQEFSDSYEILFKNRIYQSLFVLCLFIIAGFPVSIGFNGFLRMLFSFTGEYAIFYGAFLCLLFAIIFGMVYMVYKKITASAVIDVEVNRNIFLRKKLALEFFVLYALVGSAVFLGCFPSCAEFVTGAFFKEADISKLKDIE